MTFSSGSNTIVAFVRNEEINREWTAAVLRKGRREQRERIHTEACRQGPDC
jgi:hypothetical protein